MNKETSIHIVEKDSPALESEQADGDTLAMETVESPPHPESAQETDSTDSDETPVVEEATESDPVAQLTAELEAAQDQRLRALAELENVRKRARQEMAETIRYANGELIAALLPVLDNLQRALEIDPASATAESVQSGVEQVARQMMDTLRQFGLQPQDNEGAAFDPTLHEAVSTLPSTDHQDGEIVAETQRGYMLHDRVLRPAQVIVAEAQTANDGGEEDGEAS